MKPTIAIASVLAALWAGANAATVIPVHGDGTITVNYSGLSGTANLNAGNNGAVGGNKTTTASLRRTYYQISSYNVGTLLTTIGLSPVAASLGQLSNYTFEYSGITIAGTASPGADIADAYEYRAAYIGQWADTGTSGTSAGDVPTTGVHSPTTLGQTTNTVWTRYHDAAQTIAGVATGYTGGVAQMVDLNLVDDATAQTLTAAGFDLSGLATTLAADTDLSDNYVFFGFYLNPDFEIDTAVNQEIGGVTLTAIPEPAATLLGSLSLLALFRRRR